MDKQDREYISKIMDKIAEKYKTDEEMYIKMNMIKERFLNSEHVYKRIYTELANFTKLIDFRCDFKNCRQDNGGMCCCGNCAQYVGYIKHRFFSVYGNDKHKENEMLYYANKYHLGTGFWRKNKGCNLPRHRRSNTCLTYNCRGNFTVEESLVMRLISEWKNPPSYIDKLIIMLKDYFLYRKE